MTLLRLQFSAAMITNHQIEGPACTGHARTPSLTQPDNKPITLQTLHKKCVQSFKYKPTLFTQLLPQKQCNIVCQCIPSSVPEITVKSITEINLD